MNLRAFCILVLLCVSACCVASGGPQAADPSRSASSTGQAYDLASFSAELSRLDQILQAKPSPEKIAEFRRELPASWEVSTPHRIFSISTKPLQAQLHGSSPMKAAFWIEHLQVEIESFRTSTGSSVAAQQELDKILAGPQFSGVRPPTPWALLRERIEAWLERLLLKLFGGISRHPIGAQMLFWLALLAGVGFVALQVFRYFNTQDGLGAFRPESSVVASRSWQDWIRVARQAAAAGDFREAVHSAYWAGIARLEETGVLPRDRTKTPREYLRLANTPPRPSTVSPPRIYAEPLAALTQRLERIWYANRTASLDDFNDSLRQLEALGCPLE